MKHLRRRRISSYGDLWLQASRSPYKKENGKSEQRICIEKLMLKADLCEDLQSYVVTICEGMEEILGSDQLREELQRLPEFEKKVKRIGVDILEKSTNESDLYYIGVFASMKLQENWLDLKFYQILGRLIEQVLRGGMSLSSLLKRKIRAKLAKFLFENEFGINVPSILKERATG